MNLKIKKLLIAIVAVALAICHCFMVVSCTNNSSDTTTESDIIVTKSKDTTESTTVATTEEVTTKEPVIHTGDYVDSLTGYATEKDLSNTRPIAVVVDNSSLALKHQSGLNDAAIVYEGLVAPGITRFLAVYSDYEEIPYICNVRSARKFTVDWAQSHNAILVCHGGPCSEGSPYNIYDLLRERYGSNGADLIVNTQTEYWFATAEGGDMYNTIRHRGDRADLLYDTCVTKEAMEKVLTNKSSSKFVKAGGTVSGKVIESLKHTSNSEPGVAGTESATYVKLKFTASGTQTSMLVEYRYNEDTKTYVRFQEGSEHKDAETKEQLAFKNLLVIVTDVSIINSGVSTDPYMTEIRTTGSGTAYYFCNGKVQKCFWSKKSVSSELSIVDAQGKVVEMAQGNTYIGYVDTTFTSETGFYD